MGDSILEERSEEQILWERYIHTKDVRMEEALVRRFLPIVDRVVGRVAPRLPSFVSQEELRSYGYVGLLEAVRKFEPNRGISFSTYAMWRIRGAIYDGLRELDPYTRSLREKSKKIEEIQSFLEQKHLRRVGDEEIALEANLSPGEVARLRREEPESFFPELEDDEGQKLPLPWSDPNARIPEEEVERNELRDELAQAIERLPERESLILSLFYYEGLKFNEIANLLGLSPSRISQLHGRALARLRPLLERYLEEK